MTGILTIAATPIGNPADAGARLIAALAASPIVAAEDTRRLRRLAEDLGVTIGGAVVSFFEGNESARSAQLLESLLEGDDVLLVSDAGMPGVSDPGFRLVSGCAARGVPVSVLPGPSAVVAAIAVSGLPSDRFCFEGFLPRKGGERRRRLAEASRERRTMVFFESPRRLAATLVEMADALGGQRGACVCRELTKTHEEIKRGTLADLAQWARARDVLGEITLVVAGGPVSEPEGGPDEWRAAVERLVAGGASRRDAVDEVAQRFAAPRRAVYTAVHD